MADSEVGYNIVRDDVVKDRESGVASLMLRRVVGIVDLLHPASEKNILETVNVLCSGVLTQKIPAFPASLLGILARVNTEVSSAIGLPASSAKAHRTFRDKVALEVAPEAMLTAAGAMEALFR